MGAGPAARRAAAHCANGGVFGRAGAASPMPRPCRKRSVLADGHRALAAVARLELQGGEAVVLLSLQAGSAALARAARLNVRADGAHERERHTGTNRGRSTCHGAW